MKTRRLIWYLLLCAVLTILAVGCNRQSRYEVLSFLFTGVPSPEEEARTREELARQATGEDLENRPLSSSHDYFVARKCGECHQVTLSQNFGGAVRSGMPTMNFGDETTTGTSRLPLKKICASCHENRAEAFASANNLWLHAPVTKDNCLVCHEPHRSMYPDLLKDEPDKLCTMCHSEGLIRLTKSHQELKGCLECHNPHLGKDKFLLIKDYKEERKLPVPRPDTERRDG